MYPSDGKEVLLSDLAPEVQTENKILLDGGNQIIKAYSRYYENEPVQNAECTITSRCGR